MNGYCLADGWSPNKSCTVRLRSRKSRLSMDFVYCNGFGLWPCVDKLGSRSVAPPNRSLSRPAISTESRHCRLWFTSNQVVFNCGLQSTLKKKRTFDLPSNATCF